MPRTSKHEVLAEIRACALQLFVTNGYEATTLNEIAAAVGYSKSALLYHFSSKDALLAEALLEPLARLQDFIAVAQQQPRADRMAGLVDLVLHHKHEAYLLLHHGQRLDQAEPMIRLAACADQVLALFLAAGSPLQEQVAARVALAGVCETAMALPEVPNDQLGPALLATALRTIAS
ncbi:MAG: TetR/AcrR family transcriptional regulator [Actinomycetota bacterium]|nr:TetR/AcrR family transcriptional regulator [Actinomycetota bacterium]